MPMQPLHFRVLVATACVAFAGFVWPTLYRYDELSGGGAKVPIRTNRVTGATFRLTSSGWEATRSDARASATALTTAEIGRITGTLKLESHGWIAAELHNGNDFKIDQIDVQLRVIGSRGETRLDRRYRLGSTNGDPFESSSWICAAGYKPVAGDTIAWHIISATR